ncbi:MAG: polysaccharide export protein [Nitrospira sp.]|nr:polysaccharide export protein [Nitrospira sp.]
MMKNQQQLQGIALILAMVLFCEPSYMAWAQSKQGKGGGQSAAGAGQSQPRKSRGRNVHDPPNLRGAEGTISLSSTEEILPGGQALSRAVVPDQYLLGPGDGLTINLWGEYEEAYDVKVSPDGRVNLPTIGTLKVKGLSLTQAEALVETEVRKYYRNVKSGLTLASLRVFQVLVLGAVQLPGSYLATPVKRVSDIVGQAGGVVSGGSWRNIQVQREGQVVAIADLTAFLRHGDQAANPYLQDGDAVYIPPMRHLIVSVITTDVAITPTGLVSESTTPSNIELKPGEKIADLLAELGSVSPWWNLEGVYVLREIKAPEGTMKLPVDARRLLFDKDESQNFELQHGDQVFISSNVRRVFVNGVVRTGGAFTYVPNRTAEEYIGLAGGVSLQASLERSTIRRADGTVEPFSAGTILRSGDAIQIEQKYFASPSDYVGIIGGVTGLVFSMFAFLSTLK